MAWWSDLLPGEHYGLEYDGDDVAHERVAVWPSGDDHWVGYTPDGDLYAEDLRCRDPTTGPRRSFKLDAPGRAASGATKLPMYVFKESVGRGRLRALVLDARRLVGDDLEPRLTPTKALVDGSEVTLPELLGVPDRRLRGKSSPEDDRDDTVAARVAPKGYEWTLDDGSRVTAAAGDLITPDGMAGLRKAKDGWVMFSAKPVDATTTADGAANHDQDLDLAARLGLKGDSKTGGQAKPDDGQDEQDVRVLDVEWDSHGERHRDWRAVVQDSTQEYFNDAPTPGPPTALHMAKSMYRTGGDPKLWLEKFLRDKHVDSHDRTAHELRCLCEALWAAGCYDQLNLGGVSVVEVVSRRIAVIVEAYSDASKPNWAMAHLYREGTTADEVIAPSLRAHILRRAKDEAEVAGARARANTRMVPQWTPDGGAQGSGTGDDGGQSAGGGQEGRGRGSGGRGAGRRGRGVPPAGNG